MPYRLFNLDEVSQYLHLSREDVQQRVKGRAIPFEMRGERVVFRKSEIDQWASKRILGLSESRLEHYHRLSTRGTREAPDFSWALRGVVEVHRPQLRSSHLNRAASWGASIARVYASASTRRPGRTGPEARIACRRVLCSSRLAPSVSRARSRPLPSGEPAKDM